MAPMQTAPRGRLTSALWILMWLTWLGFVAQQAADVERFSGTWLLIGLRGAPLVFFLWAALTDSMRLFIWFELVLLFYFISAVEAAFAYQADILSIAKIRGSVDRDRRALCFGAALQSGGRHGRDGTTGGTGRRVCIRH